MSIQFLVYLGLTVTLCGCESASSTELLSDYESTSVETDETHPGRRIVGGWDAGQKEELGFAVFISCYRSFCSGALIAPDWVLSAAHCYHTDGYTSVFNFTAGDYNIKSDKVQSRLSYWVGKHPDAADGLSKHDIALAQTTEAFVLSPTLKVLKLWDDEWPQNKPDEVECTAYGWGRKTNLQGSQAIHLQVLKVTAAHGEHSCPCLRRFQAKRLVCAGGVEGQGLCMGDSGSALVCNGKAVGVAHVNMDKRACSFFDNPNNVCGSQYTFSYFMYLCPYLDWMKGHVQDLPSKPVSCTASRPPLQLGVLPFSLLSLYALAL